MFPLRSKNRNLPTWPLLALAMIAWNGKGRTQVLERSGEPALSVTMVNIGAHHSRPVSLAEIFSLVEVETRLKFAYAPGLFSLADEVVLPAGAAISLTELLTAVSAQQPIRFERSGDQIAVEAARPVAPSPVAERFSPAASDNPSFASDPTPARAGFAGRSKSDAVAQLAVLVSDIAANRGATRARKEKQIAAAVRSAITVAYAEVDSKPDLLALAVDLVTAASSGAPPFSETIANAAAFAPGITGIASGGSTLRAAAYRGARAPKSIFAAAATQDPTPTRSAVIRVPAGETPESFTLPMAPAPSSAAWARTDSTLIPAVSSALPTSVSSAAAAPAEPAPGNVEAAAASPGIITSLASVSPSDAPVPSAVMVFSDTGMSAFSAPPLDLPAANSLPRNEPAGADNSVVLMEQFGVEGAVVKNSQVVIRERATVSVDVITSTDFGKYIATDISDIVIRMPGLSTTTKGSFAVVRGLAERYNPILLDGMVLPSSDPERQTPELDLFPARLVDAVVVNKVFEPRLPGTSSGGAIDLRTKTLPEGQYGQFVFGFRADAGALKRDDFFGSRTEGSRDLFALGEKDRPAAPGSDAGNIALVRSTDTPWTGRNRGFPLGARFSAVVEDRIDLGGEGRAFGYSLSLGYDSSASSDETETFGFAFLPIGTKGILSDDGTTLAGQPKGESISEFEREVRIGGLATIGYAFNENHSLGLSLFLSQIGTDNITRTYKGFSGLQVPTLVQLDLLREAFATGKISPQFRGVGGEESLSRSESGYYRQRNLTDLKLSGEHKLSPARSASIEWALADIRSSQDEPDFTFLPYQQRFPEVTTDKPLFIEYGQPGRNPSRYWREVAENTLAGRIDGGIDFNLGFADVVRLRSGVYADRTERAFVQDAFYLSSGPRSTADTLDELVADVRKAPFDPGAGTQRVLNTTPAFADADRKQAAAYLSFNLPLVSERQWARKVDLLVGARMEQFELTASGRGQLFNERSADFFLSALDQLLVDPADYGTDKSADRIFARTLAEDTLHPAAALLWSPISRMNVRLGYSRTVARPSFREVGPYFTNDEVTNEIQHGNVFLRTSQVDNFDFRIEYFLPKRRDVIALSLFAKQIENPIEKVKLITAGVGTAVIGWFNNPGDAVLRGAEFEAAKNLGFLGEFGSSFTLGGNATFIDAAVPVGTKEIGFAEGLERQLFDQPEWIANAYLSFDHQQSGFSTTLSWFSISDVLRNIDTFTWNTYVAGYSRLDLTLSQRFGRHWQVRLQARNLADPTREFIADPEVATEGVVLRTFKDGRNYSFSASYDF